MENTRWAEKEAIKGLNELQRRRLKKLLAKQNTNMRVMMTQRNQPHFYKANPDGTYTKVTLKVKKNFLKENGIPVNEESIKKVEDGIATEDK